jgi:rhombotail lipoprotein
MYDIDATALISYDQLQRTDEGWWSITYWLALGYYWTPYEKNDTNTLIDAAVYHIQGRKILLRAGGSSHIYDTCIPLRLSEQLRQDSYLGFEKAVDNLIADLKEQLQQFKTKVEKTSSGTK